jgi:hypothetical protein
VRGIQLRFSGAESQGVRGMKFKKKAWLAVVIVAIPLAYLLLISFIPEDRIAGFHWSR